MPAPRGTRDHAERISVRTDEQDDSMNPAPGRFGAELRVRRWGVIGLVVLTTLAVGSISLWLVPPYWLIMGWLLTPPGGWRGQKTAGITPSVAGERQPEAPTVPADPSPIEETPVLDPAPSAESLPKPGRRKRSRGSRSKKKAASEASEPNVAATWVRVGPNQFVRVEVPLEPTESIGDPLPETPLTLDTEELAPGVAETADTERHEPTNEATPTEVVLNAVAEADTPAAESVVDDADVAAEPPEVSESPPVDVVAESPTSGREVPPAEEVAGPSVVFESPPVELVAEPSDVSEAPPVDVVADPPAVCEEEASAVSVLEEDTEPNDSEPKATAEESRMPVAPSTVEVAEGRTGPSGRANTTFRFSVTGRTWRGERGMRMMERRRRPLVGARGLPRDSAGFSRQGGGRATRKG